MRKPSIGNFSKFKERFDYFNKKHGLNQALIPYFISSHPGEDEESMAELAAETKDLGFKLEQVQDFTPTPMTMATVIYYSGVHPYTLKPVETKRKLDQKKEQNFFFFWFKNENKGKIIAKLNGMGRKDLIEKFYGKIPYSAGRQIQKPIKDVNRRMKK